jgi:alanyl-tRNA synthetase
LYDTFGFPIDDYLNLARKLQLDELDLKSMEQKNRSSFTGRRRLQQTGQIKKTMHKSL